jgi:hypothetical protein
MTPISKLDLKSLVVPVALMLLVGTQAANAQSCALCKKNSTGDCNVPTITNDCGCCPGGKT